MIKIAIVEDDLDIAKLLKLTIENEGLSCCTLQTGKMALCEIEKTSPDLLILDVGLPDIDGFEICRQIRKTDMFEKLPIIFLTCNDTPKDIIKGYDLGADDYITKPFNKEVLMAKIKVFLKRAHDIKLKGGILYVGELAFNKDSRSISIKNREVVLNNKEFKIIYLLGKRYGQPISKEEIYEEVWGFSEEFNRKSIDTYIWSIRKKLGFEVSSYIKTINKYGYKLEF